MMNSVNPTAWLKLDDFDIRKNKPMVDGIISKFYLWKEV